MVLHSEYHGIIYPLKECLQKVEAMISQVKVTLTLQRRRCLVIDRRHSTKEVKHRMITTPSNTVITTFFLSCSRLKVMHSAGEKDDC